MKTNHLENKIVYYRDNDNFNEDNHIANKIVYYRDNDNFNEDELFRK